MSESREEVGVRQHVELELSRSKPDLKAAYAFLLSMKSWGAASDLMIRNHSPSEYLYFLWNWQRKTPSFRIPGWVFLASSHIILIMFLPNLWCTLGLKQIQVSLVSVSK